MKEYKLLRIILGGTPRSSVSSEFTDYASAGELLKNEITSGVVVIDGLSDRPAQYIEKEYFSVLYELRQSEIFCFAPVFFAVSAGLADAAADGVEADIDKVLPKAFAILSAGESIMMPNLASSRRLRLLAYMYTRGEDYLLEPICVPSSKALYLYLPSALIKNRDLPGENETTQTVPLFCSMTDDDITSAAAWTAKLYSCGYIRKNKLRDRVRLCPKCRSGHLNYVDVCPQCGSINVEQSVMLHCFTCGHVAAEEDFRQDMSLVCPRCGTTLRHIGSDYDHPLESYVCSDCGASFIESDVTAMCMSCGSKYSPDKLNVRDYYSYSISDIGKTSLKTGLLLKDITIFDSDDNINYKYFCMLVHWLIHLDMRYHGSDFSLIGIRLHGLRDAENAVGTVRLFKCLDTVSQRIQALVRDTDVTTKCDANTFWLLLPHTDPAGADIVASRINGLDTEIDDTTFKDLKISAKAFQIKDELSLTIEKVETLLNHLAAEL